MRSAAPVPAELTAYLEVIANSEWVAEVIVVDGSNPGVFADFEARCSRAIKHVAVDPDLAVLANGKVAGVLTGLRLASKERVVLADDDVRYDETALAAVVSALEHVEVVRPQNYFDPLPWHACLDTARTLINRATGGDWPGTFGLRRSALRSTDGYDGNVLFENLELVRTVKAAGGREGRPLDLFVRRLPPRSPHFWTQRVRQAYDEFARPARLITALALLPALALLVTRQRWTGVGIAIIAPMIVAETGRRMGHGRRVFPATATVVAPLWVVERAICAWAALAARVFLGGVPYHGRVLKTAATPYRTLARKYAGVSREGSRTT